MKKKIRPQGWDELMEQTQQVKMFDFDQLAVYLQARNGGRSHNDAVDAVIEFMGVPL